VGSIWCWVHKRDERRNLSGVMQPGGPNQDVANKTDQQFLHETKSQDQEKNGVESRSEEYAGLCSKMVCTVPIVLTQPADTVCVIEHLDGDERYRAGLHVPGMWWCLQDMPTQ